MIRLFFILGVSVYFSSNIQAKPLSNQELAKIQAKMKAHKFVSLKFEQTRFKSLRKKEVKSTGSALFKTPNKFVWSLDHSQQAWIFDGRTLLHYDKVKKAAVGYGNTAAKGKELRKIIALVTRFDHLQKDYMINGAEQTGDILSLSMAPHHKTGELKSVEVKFDTDKHHITFLKLKFAAGNYSSFRFFGRDTKDISDATFSVPKGTKIKEVR